MANNENLKPIKKGQLSSAELKKRQSNGGKKSGEVRRARKTLKEELLLLLSEGEIQNKICLAIIKQCQKGNVKAFGILRDTIGEMPTQKQQITGADGAPLAVQKIYVTPDEVKATDNHIDQTINE